jgi:plastocyanin
MNDFWQRQARRPTVRVLSILFLVGGIALAALAAGSKSDVRDIRLVARGVTFYVDGRPEANPVLRVEAGERIRLLFRNEDRGMAHNFAVSGWRLSQALPLEPGETASVVVRVPDHAGRYTYVCTPHAALMHGVIEVR